MLFLTKRQEKVLKSLSVTFLSVTEIATITKLPRTTVSTVLKSLEQSGFVASKKIKYKNKHLYKKVDDKKIQKALNVLEKHIVEDKVGIKTMPFLERGGISLLLGKDSIIKTLKEMMSMEKGERIYTLQPSGSTKQWNKAIGEKEVLYIHSLFKKNGLIVVSVAGKYEPGKVLYSNEIIESFKDRLDQSYFISDNFLEDNTAVYVYRSSLLFVDIDRLIGIHIQDKKISSIIKKIILFISVRTDRIRKVIDN